MVNDHRIKIGSEIRGLQLIRDDKGVALYNVTEDIPNYQAQLRFRQNDWLGGHGQYDFTRGDMYFEGQSIDTTQEGRILLGPLINSVGTATGTLGANPVCFCWFNSISKLMVATATKVFWYDDTNFVKKWDRANHDWANSHGFITDDWVRPSTYNGHIYECTSAGTGGASEPDPWTTTDGDTEVTSGATFTCRSITITDMVDINDVLYVCLGSGTKYYYSTNGSSYTQNGLDDGYATKIFAAPNPAGTATVLWKFRGSTNPNELKYTTDGRTVEWSSAAYMGDTSNDITNIFLVNDNLMIGKEDNLWHFDSDGGTHPLMNDLGHNRSSTNFKYVTEWQTGTYFSLITGIGEITSYNAFDTMGPLQDAMDINKIGTCVGLASDKDWMYPVMDEGTNNIIYKGREVRRQGALRWDWCPWVFLGENACATAKVCQHSATDRRLWFGYGNYAGYVILTDNPTATGSGATFCPSAWIRMSYIYGTDKYWDKLFQSLVTETKSCTSGKTVTPKYRKDTDTSATVLTPAITTNGIINTNLGNEIDCKRIQFECHLATNSSSTTPEVLYFEARGIEKPETVRVHEATYAIGDTPSKRAKTIRDFLRSARTSKKLIKFADLRYGQSIDKDYTWVVMQPGYPREVEIQHTRNRQPELGIQVRWQEIKFS